MTKVNKLVISILLSLAISLSFIYSVNAAESKGEATGSSGCPIISPTCELTAGSKQK